MHELQKKKKKKELNSAANDSNRLVANAIIYEHNSIMLEPT